MFVKIPKATDEGVGQQGRLRYSVIIAILAMLTSSAGQRVLAAVGNPSNPTALQAAILSAYAAHTNPIVITPGNYYIPGGGSQDGVVTLNGLSNVTIVTDGVDITIGTPVSSWQSGISLQNCSNVTFGGTAAATAMGLNYNTPQIGQGKIAAIGSDSGGTYFDILPEAGYLAAPQWQTSYDIDPGTMKTRAGAYNVVLNSSSVASSPAIPGAQRVHWAYYGGTNAQVNDYIVCRAPNSGSSPTIGNMFSAEGCVNCTFQYMTVYWGGLIGFSDQPYYGSSTVYGNNNHFMYDSIAIHGEYQWVAKPVTGSTTIVVSPPYGSGINEIQAGDHIRIDDFNTGALSTATVVSVTGTGNPGGTASGWPQFQTVGSWFKLTLNTAVTVGYDALVNDIDKDGKNYFLFGNNITNNFTRGIYVKADGGSIIGNTVNGSPTEAIVVGPEPEYNFDESGYVQSANIAGNTIMNCGYSYNDSGSYMGGTICVIGYNSGPKGNSGITINGNLLVNNGGCNLALTYCSGAAVTANTFGSPGVNANVGQSTNSKCAVDCNSVISENNGTGYSFQQNLVTGIGSNDSVTLWPAGLTNGVINCDKTYNVVNIQDNWDLTDPSNGPAGTALDVTNDATQIWKFVPEYAMPGYCYLNLVANTSVALDTAGQTANGTQLYAEAYGPAWNATSQQWTFLPSPFGGTDYILQNKATGYDATLNGASVDQFGLNGFAWQSWSLIP